MTKMMKMKPKCAQCGRAGCYIGTNDGQTWTVVCSVHVEYFSHAWPILTATGRKAIDMTGRTIGNLRVVERKPVNRGDYSAFWICRCRVCDPRITISGQRLRTHTMIGLHLNDETHRVALKQRR